MKEWFKHQYGFVNVDEENVYVTKTGNWSEVKTLKEKNYKPLNLADFSTKLKIGIYMVVVLGFVLFAFISNIISGNISFLLIVGLPILGYTAFQYIIPEFGSSFVIPKEKIKLIHLEASDVRIEFLDANNKETSNHFRSVNQQGIETMYRIKAELNN